MKKPLYYSILPSWRPRLVAVTLERGVHWWGRDVRDDVGTHGRTSALRGRFPTLEAAMAVQEQIQAVHTHYRLQGEVLSSVRTELNRAEEAMVSQIVDGSPKLGVPPAPRPGHADGTASLLPRMGVGCASGDQTHAPRHRRHRSRRPVRHRAVRHPARLGPPAVSTAPPRVVMLWVAWEVTSPLRIPMWLWLLGVLARHH